MRTLFRRSVLAVAVLGLLVGASGKARAGTTIDTMPLWNGANFISSFGVPETATYGQSITVPVGPDTVLTDFTFQIDGFSADPLTFKGYVFAWDGSKATGSALFTSPTTTVASGSGFNAVTFNTGGVQLTAGSQYVLFASVSETGGNPTQSGWGYLGTSVQNGQDGYTGGNFVFENNGTDTSQWTSTVWNNPTFFGGHAADDLAFTAHLNAPAPEPSTIISGAIGIVMLSGYTWRRRRRAVV